MSVGYQDYGMLGVPASTYHLISAASTNADTVKASGGLVVGYYIANVNAAFRYVKLYDKASDPTVGTDTPLVVLGIPGDSAANMSFFAPVEFATGIAIATTAGMEDSNSTAVGLDDLAVSLYYI